MAVNDYKVLNVFVINGTKVEHSCGDIVDGIRYYLHGVSKGAKLSVYVVVSLKRRQSIDSFKKQVEKAIIANEQSLAVYAGSFSCQLLSSFLRTVVARMSVEADAPECITPSWGEFQSFCVVGVSDDVLVRVKNKVL